MMTDPAERYARLHAILADARDLAGDRLDAYLTAACGDDPTLRAEVLELLAAGADERREDAFAEGSVNRARQALEALVDNASDSTWLPERIGNYRIVRQIGQGGMGIVYEAKQESPHRSVALKLLHPIHATPDRLRRFRQEAELLGRLQHPGIAQIFEAGAYDVGRGPQPFIAMQLVEGVDIRTHCEHHELDRATRIELLARVADAVQYAHDHGVVHRDLKPDNVLVNDNGRPRILDFGIARATDPTSTLATMLTESGQLVGTLAYMAPEQLSQTTDAVTPQVDVYALGVLGFELLTGRLPRTIADLPVSKAIALLASSEPPRASLFDAGLKGDLETILGKALEHEPARRYASAAALAGDLRRFLADRPIEARPPSRIYLVRKFTRRHRGLVSGVAATLAVALTGAVVAGRYAIDATQRADALERASYISGIAAASSAVREQDYAAAAARLDRVPAAHRGWEYDYLRARLTQYEEEWEAPPAPLLSNPVFDGQGRRLFAMLRDGSIATWSAANGRLLPMQKPDGIRGTDAHGSAVLDGGSLRFAAGGVDDDIAFGSLDEGVLTSRLRFAAAPAQPKPLCRVLAWDAAGQRLLYSTDAARIWDGAHTRALTSEGFALGAFNHAGDRVALASGATVSLFDAATGERLGDARFDDQIVDLAFAPNDEALAVAGYYRNAYLLNSRTLDIDVRLVGHQNAVHRVTWTTDGSRLVTTSQDGTARIWNTDGRGSPIVHATGERGEMAITAAVTPDGEHVVVAGERLRLFPAGDPTVLRGHESYVYFLTFSPDGSLLASVDWMGRNACVWEVDRAQLRWRFPSPASLFVAFSADNRRLVSATTDALLQWDVTTGTALPLASSNLEPRQQFFEMMGWYPLIEPKRAMSKGGDRLAATHGNRVRLLVRSATPPDSAADDFLQQQDGSWWRPSSGLIGHVGEVYCAAFSPDGTRIATGGNDATVRIWDAQTCEQLLLLRGHEQYVSCVAFSPDGTLLASASGDTTVRLWDTKPLFERRAMGGK